MMQANLFSENPPPPRPVAPTDEGRVKLRSTQPLAIKLVHEELMKGNKRIIICAPCGFGKSVVACRYIERSLTKGKSPWFVVDREPCHPNERETSLLRDRPFCHDGWTLEVKR